MTIFIFILFGFIVALVYFLLSFIKSLTVEIKATISIIASIFLTLVCKLIGWTVSGTYHLIKSFGWVAILLIIGYVIFQKAVKITHTNGGTVE